MSLIHWVVVLLAIVVLFGAGKIPRIMGDIGRGVRNLRDELNKDETGQQVLPPDDKK